MSDLIARAQEWAKTDDPAADLIEELLVEIQRQDRVIERLADDRFLSASMRNGTVDALLTDRKDRINYARQNRKPA